MPATKAKLDTYSHNFYSRGAEPALENIQVAKISGNAKFDLHQPDSIQLLYFTKGRGTLWVNGSPFALAPGMLAQLYPYHISHMDADQTQEIEFYRCCFPLSVLMYLDIDKRFVDTDFSVVERGSFLFPLSGDDSARTANAFEEICLEMKEKQPFYLNAILGNLFRLLAIFDRQAKQALAKNGPIERSLGWQALQYIHMYFNKSGIDAAFVAAHFEVTPLYLGHILHQLTGQGFAANLHDVRIRNACAMMFFEELTLAFIAHYVGYTSLSTFYRVFKQTKGVTPEQYRSGAVGVPIGKHRDTCWKMLAYLLENYTEAITPATLAAHFYMGEDTVAPIFTQNFGVSMPELLEQIRLTYACALLGAKNLPVYSVAMAVGFNSTRTFSRSFKQNVGITPSQYRESLV